MSTDTMEAPAQSMELAKAEDKIQQGLALFNDKKSQLEALVKTGTGLKVTDINDKKALAVLSTVRKQLKAERVDIEKQGKAMRDHLTVVSKNISAKEKELIEIIEPTEKELLSEEKRVEEEKEKLRIAAEQAEKARVQARIDKLAAFGYSIDLNTITTIDDATFAAVVTNAEAEYNKEQERIAEEKRQQEAEAERLRQEQAAEQEKLRKEREELEALRKKQAEAQRIIDENNARVAKELADKAAAMKAEQDRIDAEKKRIEDEKLAAEREAQRQAELQKAREEAAEKARLQAIEDAKQAEAMAAEKLAQSSDKVKFAAVITQLQAITVPEMKSKKAKALATGTAELIGKLVAYINNGL